MEARLTYEGRSRKTVHVPGDLTEAERLDIALRVAGETLSALFGWHVEGETVILYTD